MHADMTAVTIQSNKFVSNEVKASVQKKLNELFGQPNRRSHTETHRRSQESPVGVEQPPASKQPRVGFAPSAGRAALFALDRPDCVLQHKWGRA